MDPVELAHRLEAIERRGAGSDAERRAARLLQGELKRLGRRDARARTMWVRPQWAAVHAVLCAVAVVANVVAIDHPAAGVGLAAGALLLFLADVSGRLPLLRRATFARATQNVVSRDAREAAVRVVLTAPIDAPRAGLLDAGAFARAAGRLQRAAGGRLPGRFGVVFGALALTVLFCGLRLAGVEGSWLGPAQLVPTVVLLALVGLLLDAATAKAPRRGTQSAAACAAALAVVEALEQRPTRALAVDVVLHGASGAHALGMRGWIREERRRGRRAEEVAVLALEGGAAGTRAWWAREGLILPLRAHPTLAGHAAATAEAAPHLGAVPTRSAGTSAARAARAVRWPALRLGTLGSAAAADDPDLEPAALQATVDLALGIIRRLDAEVTPQPAADEPPEAAPGLPPTSSIPGSRHARRAARDAAREAAQR